MDFEVPGRNVEIHSPSKARDGLTTTRPSVVSTMLIPTSVLACCPSWRQPATISTFRPGIAFAIAVAVEQLTAELPDGHWFAGKRLSRDFSPQSSRRAV